MRVLAKLGHSWTPKQNLTVWAELQNHIRNRAGRPVRTSKLRPQLAPRARIDSFGPRKKAAGQGKRGVIVHRPDASKRKAPSDALP
jgi:hypothetical protein